MWTPRRNRRQISWPYNSTSCDVFFCSVYHTKQNNKTRNLKRYEYHTTKTYFYLAKPKKTKGFSQTPKPPQAPHQENGQTPLFLSASKGSLSILQVLLQQRADCDRAECQAKATPLWLGGKGGWKWERTAVFWAFVADKTAGFCKESCLCCFCKLVVFCYWNSCFLLLLLWLD